MSRQEVHGTLSDDVVAQLWLSTRPEQESVYDTSEPTVEDVEGKDNMPTSQHTDKPRLRTIRNLGSSSPGEEQITPGESNTGIVGLPGETLWPWGVSTGCYRRGKLECFIKNRRLLITSVVTPPLPALGGRKISQTIYRLCKRPQCESSGVHPQASVFMESQEESRLLDRYVNFRAHNCKGFLLAGTKSRGCRYFKIVVWNICPDQCLPGAFEMQGINHITISLLGFLLLRFLGDGGVSNLSASGCTPICSLYDTKVNIKSWSNSSAKILRSCLKSPPYSIRHDIDRQLTEQQNSAANSATITYSKTNGFSRRGRTHKPVASRSKASDKERGVVILTVTDVVLIDNLCIESQGSQEWWVPSSVEPNKNNRDTISDSPARGGLTFRMSHNKGSEHCLREANQSSSVLEDTFLN
ncbi:hypothetical protein J6590_104959 [Homalodisca vitripennis]|nr:hypothetical protein J6590_104959 [Homalodisca vitripennis]